MPTFGSLFAGIGGFDLGLERAGWTNIWQVEIDEWRSQILERHWPESPRWGDIRTFPPFEDPDWKVDLICGGFPCQDLSVAGKRAGLAGERSGLFFEFARVVELLQPRWVLVENVPGLLSSHEGQDMGVVLETLSELRYGLAWRVLDSQHFGVPQRRRRVYIVGHLGSPCPPEILFEPEGGGGDSQAGGKAGQGVAHALRASPRGVDEHTGTTYVTAFAWQQGDDSKYGADGRGRSWLVRAGDYAAGLSRSRHDAICAPADADGVRAPTGVPGRLDPCSRCPDGRRYAALGDAVTTNVISWIGRRLLEAHRNIE